MVSELTVEECKDDFAAIVRQTSLIVKNLAVQMEKLTGWHGNQTMAFETLAANMLKQYLLKCGITEEHITEMPRDYAKIDQRKYARFFGEAFPRGVEWDAALFVDHPDTHALTLFLVEAKTTIETSDIQKMGERIARTHSFIELCVTGQILGEDAPGSLEALCDAWSQWGLPSAFCGAVLSNNVTEPMLEAAKEQQVMCMCLDGSAFVVHRPWLSAADGKVMRFDQVDAVLLECETG